MEELIMEEDNTGILLGKAVLSVFEDRIKKVNNAFLELTGYSEKQLIEKSPKEVFHKLLRSNADISKIKPGAEPFTCFIFTRLFEPIEVVISIETAYPKEIHLYEKPSSRLNEKIRSNERLFFDNKIGVCILSSPDLILLKANDFFLNIIDAPFNSRDNAIGRSIKDIVPDEMMEKFFGIRLEKLIHTNQSFYGDKYSKTIDKDGKSFRSSMVLPYIENDELKFFTAVFIEITEYIKEKDQIQNQKRIIEQQKEQFETIIENMSDSLIITDINHNIILMNAAARTYYPDPDRFNNMAGWFKMIHVTDENGNRLSIEDMPSHRAARGERVKDFRTNILGPNGPVNVEYSSAPLYDNDGNISMIINCSRNVTEEVRSVDLITKNQEELLMAEMEKNEALKKAIELKDKFLSLISHELKTPITVIISAIQAMEYLCGDQFSEKAQGFIGRIKQNAFRQLRLVNNLLEITKIESGQLKLKMGNYDVLFLASSITESVQEYAKQKNINLSFSASDNSIVTGIDDEKFERILLNLLSNAIKFTPKGKSVFVRVYKTFLDQCAMVAVEVLDEGIGISESNQTAIFEKFVQVDSSLTRQAEGTGLGLFLVKQFVDALEGVINLESHEGKGSKFTVLLPIRQAELHPANPQSVQAIDNRLIQSVKIELSDLY